MINSDYYKKEYDVVRQELLQLKTCQIQFLTFSITTTAIILGLSKAFMDTSDKGMDLASFIFITPLFLLIPSGIVFFDKAVTISRAVGYSRILEKLQLSIVDANNFIGFENALSFWRIYPFKENKKNIQKKVIEKRENQKKAIESVLQKKYPTNNQAGTQKKIIDKISLIMERLYNRIFTFSLLQKILNYKIIRKIFDFIKSVYQMAKKMINILFLLNPLRYWMIIFYTYTGLSAACLFFSYKSIQKNLPLIFQEFINGFASPLETIILILTIIFILFFLYLFYFVWHLVFGHFTYDYNEMIWWDILDVNKKS